jgi:hypothetical protein
MAKCPRCQAEVSDKDLRPLMGEKVREDCYIKLVDFTKECDPWASYTAKRTMEQQGAKLNPDEQKLYDLVKIKQEIPLKMAAKELNWDEEKTHEQVIMLRHVDLIKTKVVGPDTVLSL